MRKQQNELTLRESMMMSNVYECPICLSLNHVSRLSCSTCGTIPNRYSWNGKTINHEGRDVVAAYGVSRASQHHGQKVYLRTVTLDYYASTE